MDPDQVAILLFTATPRGFPPVVRAVPVALGPITVTNVKLIDLGAAVLLMVGLTVLVREDHPLSSVIPRAPRETPPSSEVRYRLPTLPSGNADEALRDHLSILARSGMPVVLEKSIADRINLDDLSPRVVGPNGVQVLQRQTLRVWNTLAVWMREYTRSPRGMASPLRAESPDDLLPQTSGAEPPFLP
jgi:hypothetical protein